MDAIIDALASRSAVRMAAIKSARIRSIWMQLMHPCCRPCPSIWVCKVWKRKCVARRASYGICSIIMTVKAIRWTLLLRRVSTSAIRSRRINSVTGTWCIRPESKLCARPATMCGTFPLSSNWFGIHSTLFPRISVSAPFCRWKLDAGMNIVWLPSIVTVQEAIHNHRNRSSWTKVSGIGTHLSAIY